MLARLTERHDGKGSTGLIADFDGITGNISPFAGRPPHKLLSNKHGFRARLVQGVEICFRKIIYSTDRRYQVEDVSGCSAHHLGRFVDDL